MAQSPPVKVKKVKPYPFSVNLQFYGQSFFAQVQVVTPIGFVADVGPKLFKVGTTGIARLTLPVLEIEIEHQVKVIKMSDRYAVSDKNNFQVVRSVEFHFLSPDEGKVDSIKKFMSAIGQK